LGCDGTCTIKGSGGLKGHFERDMPWILANWCLVHKLELSIRDSLKTTFFETLDELQLQIFYVYYKSPKKCNELKEIVEELQQCFEDYDMPHKGGARPLQACGARFVA